MRLDEMYDMWNSKALRDRITRRPSDYWRTNCAITATFISRGEVEMREQIGITNLLWGSDYPHPEGTWPYTDACLQHAFHGIPQQETARILGENALDFYDFDREEMRKLANRIGPSRESVLQEPANRPEEYLGMGMR